MRKLFRSEKGFALPAALVVAAVLLIAGVTSAEYARVLSRATADDRALVQARMAADTGIERAKIFLMAYPLWKNGEMAEGPVDETSEVEEVTIEHTTQDGRQMAVVTSTGRCRNVRKTVQAVVETGLVSLISAYGGGVKQLKGETGFTVGGNSWARSEMLINGSLTIQGNGRIGSPSSKRTVYVDGTVNTREKGAIFGDVYATSEITGTVSGEKYSYWDPPVSFPDIEDVNALIGIARVIAWATEQATGEQRYFPLGKTFTASELKNLEGVYFVEGDAYVQGGAADSCASIVAANNISVTGSLLAERLVLMAGDSINLKNASGTSVALAVAKGDAGWGTTGGGRAAWTLKYGALVAGTVNGGFLRGSVVLEQNDAVDFGTLAAPIHTARVISRTEL